MLIRCSTAVTLYTWGMDDFTGICVRMFREVTDRALGINERTNKQLGNLLISHFSVTQPTYVLQWSSVLSLVLSFSSQRHRQEQCMTTDIEPGITVIEYDVIM